MIFIFFPFICVFTSYFTTIYEIKLYGTWLNIRSYCSKLCDTIILHFAIPCHTTLYYTTLNYATLLYTTLNYTVAYHIIAYYSILWHIILFTAFMLSQDTLKAPFLEEQSTSTSTSTSISFRVWDTLFQPFNPIQYNTNQYVIMPALAFWPYWPAKTYFKHLLL